jgi:hypothetical protein
MSIRSKPQCSSLKMFLPFVLRQKVRLIQSKNYIEYLDQTHVKINIFIKGFIATR